MPPTSSSETSHDPQPTARTQHGTEHRNVQPSYVHPGHLADLASQPRSSSPRARARVRLPGRVPAAALRPGENVIDVGCGTGTSALQAIEQLMPGGALVGIDINPDLTNIATHRSRDIDGLTIVTADATNYRPTQDVDAIISRFGTMLCTDPVGAHRNLAAGLRPGGRLVCVVWQAPNRNLWHALPEHAIRAHLDLEWPDVTEAPGPFALADPARIEWLLHEASLHVVRVDPIEARCWIAADIDGAIDFFDATSRQLLHPSASAETIDAIHHTLRASLEPYQTCAGIEVPSSAWLIEATRP